MTDPLELVVTGREAIADGVLVLTLSDPAGGELPAWSPGAHIDVVLRPDLERQYSLCGDPADRRTWRIGVLREPDGRGGSAFVHDRVRAGDPVRVRGPRNNFALVPAESYLFIAGGIGITPLLPMLREADARGAPWRLVYGGRREPSMGFLDELRPYGDRVTVWPQDRNGLLDLDTLLAEPRPGQRIYCCGPEPLLVAVEQRCAGWPDTLHLERFRPRAGALDGATTAFEIRLDYSELTVAVRADQSIVDAMVAAGVEVTTSCREGTCGTCETAVLEGIPDHRDSMLTAAERAANDTMMICCSRSFTPVLVLDL